MGAEIDSLLLNIALLCVPLHTEPLTIRFWK